MQDSEKVNTKINFTSAAFRKYFANTSWLFGEKVVRLLLTFFVQILIVRYLGVEQVGLLNFALAFVGFFTAISTLGLDSIVTRELIKQPHNTDYLLGTVFWLRLAGAVLSSFLLYVAIIISGDSYDTVLLIIIIAASFFFQIFYVIDYYFQAKVQVKYSVYSLAAAFLISSVIKVILVLLEASLVYFAVITSLEFLFTSIGFLIAYRKKGGKVSGWKFDKSMARALLKDSWPLILSGVVIAVYAKIDQVMIKYILNAAENGYYSVAVRLCESWYIIPVAISNSLFPAIVNSKENRSLYMSRLQKLYDLLAWIAIAIAVPVTFLSDFIITTLYGIEFLPSSMVLTIYIWAGVGVFLGVASSQYLITENMTKLSFFRTLGGMIANIGLNLWLIPLYGINGAAIATLISYSIATFAIGFSKKTFFQLGMMLKSILFINLFIFLYKQWQSRLAKS